ncbi:MAG: AAA family ATPase, partial [Candidatus Limnocylindria bacterium]
MALRELTVENLAVVESVRLALGDGFTVVTGETGAGKSLVVDAVALALGARASTDQVRAGT